RLKRAMRPDRRLGVKAQGCRRLARSPEVHRLSAPSRRTPLPVPPLLTVWQRAIVAGLCRHYFVINGTLVYTPGFGTNNRDAMFDLYDRTARSFVLEQTPSSPDP